MKKRAILIDGNNLLYRSYYATAYSGNFMNNSKGFPTNALYGFVNMLNKIINEEKPEYIMCAFDKGKNFRKELCETYKAGRMETPEELKKQFPIAKQICELLGIKAIECDNYEADDIIGTFARMADEDKLYNALIVSSDKDLLQLISPEVEVKLLKQKNYVLMTEETFYEHYGIAPINMIDLKALMGDASDNIPGVRGIGEKTALTLLKKYKTLDGVYENIDNITGKTKDKLTMDKDMAYFSYKLATIFKEIDFDYTFENIKYKKANVEALTELYKELEFNSFLKNIPSKKDELEFNFEIVKGRLNITNKFSYYLEVDNTNYHKADIIGCGIYDGNNLYYLDKAAILLNKDIFDSSFITFDLKKNIYVLNKYNIHTNSEFDTMIASYLLNYITKDDVAYLSQTFGTDIEYYENIISSKNNLKENDIMNIIVFKAKFLYETYNTFIEKLKEEELYDLYFNLEHPLIKILAEMEITGIKVNTKIIDDLKDTLNIKLDTIRNTIYNYAGEEFNISSPKQLAHILYEKLYIPKGRGKNAMSTAHDALIKHSKSHPIINEIIEYRNLSKLVSTYLDTFNNYVENDSRIHTIYKQNVTRTGRLSSIEPNLQNIPVRTEEGRTIRKAFIASDNHSLLSSDYSQIELRVLADITDSKELKEAFINNEDIHTKVASDIFDIEEEKVTKNQRRTAKAVIFGIVYGISGYGLGENLDIDMIEANKYIKKYLKTYPSVNKYMEEIVEKAKKTGCVRTLFGRKREIEEIKSNNYLIRSSGERMALNTPIQGTAADILKIAMIKLDRAIKENNLNAKILLQVHDELILEVSDNELEKTRNLVEKVMENAYTLSVPLKVEIECGKSWYEA